MMKKGIQWIFLVFSMSQPVFAELYWEHRTLDFKAGPNDTNVVAHFAFENRGTNTVNITSLKTCCDCTIAELDKKTYLPGEKGQVNVRFLFGDRTGPQKKQIDIQTDDAREPAIPLTLNVNIPLFVKITPSVLDWIKGDLLTSKSITVQVMEDIPMKINRFEFSIEGFDAELKTIKEGKEYVFHVTPGDTSASNFAVLQIEMDFPKEKPRVFQAIVQIR